MLTPVEADLARRDPEVPGLATVLDPDAFRDALSRALPAVPLGAASIRHIKYRPHTYCRVTYRVEVAGAEVELDGHAARRESFQPPPAAGETPGEPGPLGAPHVILPESAVLVTVLPHDARLPEVERLNDPATRTEIMAELLPDHPRFASCEIRTLRHWSGRRCSAELRAEDGTRALLKIYTARGFGRALRNARAFHSWQPLRVARVMGTSDRRRLLVFEWLPGRQLSEIWLDPEHGAAATAGTGTAVALLHAQPAESLAPWSREDERAYLLRLAGEIGFICPWLAARAERLAQRLAARVGWAPVVGLARHNDLSDSQVLLERDEVSIVDLDSACRADPADDLGSLLAQAESYRLRGKLPAPRLLEIREALMRGYREVAPVPRRIALYTAAALLRRARFEYRAHRPDWMELTAATLERATDLSIGPD